MQFSLLSDIFWITTFVNICYKKISLFLIATIKSTMTVRIKKKKVLFHSAKTHLVIASIELLTVLTDPKK